MVDGNFRGTRSRAKKSGMTAQISDTIRIGSEDFSIAGVKGTGLFTPEALGVVTQASSTACWRGYVAGYALLEGSLRLVHLTLNPASSTRDRAPTLILVSTQTRREVRRLNLGASPVVIGSDPSCPLVIDDAAVPARSVRITPGEPFARVEVLAGEVFLGDEFQDDSEPQHERLSGASSFRYGSVLTLGAFALHFLFGPADPGPPIFGVLPTYSGGFSGGIAEYHSLNELIPFSGGILAARDFIQEHYVHMGFHPVWKYRSIRELVFDSGALIVDNDRSIQMAELRAKLPATGGDRVPSTKERLELDRWLRQCFTLGYGKSDDGPRD